jgi:RHS repeat-associated protein
MRRTLRIGECLAEKYHREDSSVEHGATRVAMQTHGNVYYLLSDDLGSTTLTVDSNRSVIDEQRYTAWGEVRLSTGTTPTNYTYTGQYSYTNSFGLMFYNARWYDPSLGRFAQADTVVPSGVEGYDRYVYVNNNPVINTDPSGHCTTDPDDPCNGNGGNSGSGGNGDGSSDNNSGNPPTPTSTIPVASSTPAPTTTTSGGNNGGNGLWQNIVSQGEPDTSGAPNWYDALPSGPVPVVIPPNDVIPSFSFTIPPLQPIGEGIDSALHLLWASNEIGKSIEQNSTPDQSQVNAPSPTFSPTLTSTPTLLPSSTPTPFFRTPTYTPITPTLTPFPFLP